MFLRVPSFSFATWCVMITIIWIHINRKLFHHEKTKASSLLLTENYYFHFKYPQRSHLTHYFVTHNSHLHTAKLLLSCERHTGKRNTITKWAFLGPLVLFLFMGKGAVFGFVWSYKMANSISHNAYCTRGENGRPLPNCNFIHLLISVISLLRVKYEIF